MKRYGYVGANEAAAIVGVTPQTLRVWMRAGTFPPQYFREGQVRGMWRRRDLKAWQAGARAWPTSGAVRAVRTASPEPPRRGFWSGILRGLGFGQKTTELSLR